MNLFEVTDYRLEKEKKGPIFTCVETEAVRFLQRLITEEWSAVMIGERGVGKSSTIHQLAIKSTEEKRIIGIPSPNNITEIVNELWNVFVSRVPDTEQFKEIKKIFKAEKGIKYKTWFYPRKIKKGIDAGKCKYYPCRRKERCLFRFTENDDKNLTEIIQGLNDVDYNCPVKRLILKHLLDFFRSENRNEKDQLVFLIGLPGNYTKYNNKILESFIEKLRCFGGVFIVSTPKQYEICKFSESICRLPVVNFPLPTKKDLQAMIEWKMKRYRDEFTIEEKELDKLIKKSNFNPRKLFQFCNIYKYMKKYSLPEEDARKKNFQLPGHSTTEKLSKQELVVKEAREKYRNIGWVKVKEIRMYIKTNYYTDISNTTLGKILKGKLGLLHKYNPDSEYLF